MSKIVCFPFQCLFSYFLVLCGGEYISLAIYFFFELDLVYVQHIYTSSFSCLSTQLHWLASICGSDHSPLGAFTFTWRFYFYNQRLIDRQPISQSRSATNSLIVHYNNTIFYNHLAILFLNCGFAKRHQSQFFPWINIGK